MIFNPEGKDMIPDESDIFDHLITSGAMEIAGLDSETGDFLYTFTPKIKDVMPQLYREHLKNVNGEIMNLWEKGFLNVDLMQDDPLVTLSEKSFDIEEISTLSDKEKWSLSEIKRMLKVI